ncbi:phytanoyl-CoA dioxygenase [Lewinellaceae bacterium SD302]|nr:phytanoyl-CoA dioxygenase [Lewinellaceae bacterium SD302]
MITFINKNSANSGFGIRYFLRDNPEVLKYILKSEKFKEVVKRHIENPVVIKSIYFDKPPRSNWPVNWHQDITVNLKSKIEDTRFKNWRVLDDRVVVQPSIELLKSILTFRIHLDRTDENNGALSVIDDSEDDGIIRIDKEYLDRVKLRISTTEIGRGGVMIMSPLIVHSSRRSKSNDSRRRVIHLEITDIKNAARLPFIEFFKIE